MMIRFVGLLISLLLLALPSSNFAAEANTGQTDTVEEESEATTEPGQSVDGQPVEIAGNPNSDTQEEEVQDSSDRFIPTEQISQDLGVSFPVDI